MSIEVLDWRRRVADIYREVRSSRSAPEAHARWLAARDELFARHPASPIPAEARAGFEGLRYFAYDGTLRFEAPVETELEPAAFTAQTGTDGLVRFERLGTVGLPGVGSLDVWWLAGYGGGVFVPFADPGAESYGGGRYVLDTVKGADLGGDFDAASGRGTLVVDLNFAYNPSCAYDPLWACPLAPPGNRLPVAVAAGEKIPPAAASGGS